MKSNNMLEHVKDRVHTWKSDYSQHGTDHVRETVPSHSLVGKRTRRGGRRRGRDEATFFPEEGGFRGAWVKSLQWDCNSVHEKSAPHMPIPPHSPCSHCITIPMSSQSSLEKQLDCGTLTGGQMILQGHQDKCGQYLIYIRRSLFSLVP